MNHKNSNNDNNDMLYKMECCDPSEEEPDDILLSSDLENDKESEASL